MKVKIKKTGEIINAADYATIVLDKCNSYGNPIELKLEEVELIDDTDILEMEHKKRVISLAEKIFISYNANDGYIEYQNALELAERIVEKEDKYIKK